MLQFSAQALLESIVWLTKIDDLQTAAPDTYWGNGEQLDMALLFIEKLDAQLQILGLRFSLKKLNTLRICLTVTGPNSARAKLFTSDLNELRERIEQELEDRIIYCVNPSSSFLLAEKDQPFGGEVAEAFPTATPDIAEAAICLAMARSTASVFHLMRAMEVAVSQLGAALGATIIDKNQKDLSWGKIIAGTRAKIESLPESENRGEWSASFAMLYHVKQAWRNETMHPRETHTEQEARDIFNAVKSFMKNLAPLVSELKS